MDNTMLLLISNALTGVAAWAVGKRKTNAETDNVVLKNLESSVGLYKLIIDNLRDEIQLLNGKMEQMEIKIDELTKENIKLRQLLKKNA
jgi:predicted  nucleic acid-binding Zn-ribbon protein